MTELMLKEPFASLWKNSDAFAEARQIQGKIFRAKEGRKTLSFTLQNRNYFLKYHAGVGWKEIFKNVLQLRLPVLGASNEYHAALELHKLGVATLTPVAFGKKGFNPARQHSFLITEALENCSSLEDICKHWPSQKPSFLLKKAVIESVAKSGRIMHSHGINHRDYYLCHFLLENDAPEKIRKAESFHCYLIDLHRAGQHKKLPLRWQIKDLSGLLYSTMDIGLTRRDYFRYIKNYTGLSLRDTFRCDRRLWLDVVNKACELYRKDFRKNPPLQFLELQARLQETGKRLTANG
ncbi:MAG: lipopolysaccharide core heptose(I) kinase RfaP [Pseudomonadales bacterium]|nr:lipopolysaccharide core heptose(I) kinase RfaP [Pseudomonadales bacterium]